MLAFAAMSLALSLSATPPNQPPPLADPPALHLEEPSLAIPKAAPATLGVDTRLAPRAEVNLNPNLGKAALASAAVVGGLGLVAIVGAVTVVVIGAVLVVWVAAELVVAGLKVGQSFGGGGSGASVSGGYGGSL